jgi:uncharacterized protein (DUF2236 family)
MSSSSASLTDRVESVRRAIADTLRDRVVGDNAEEKREAIMAASGPRWFSPDRPIHTVHTDASMFIGGMRALLLQSLHPLAMAGVAQHSDYKADPWGRLQRTADFLATTSFGPAEIAEQTIARIRKVHSFVHGTASDGRPYSASDPHLLRWVHVAEVDSFIAAHRAYGAKKLSEATYDGYVEDMAVIARKLGVTAPPTSVQGLRDQLFMFRGELQATPESRDVARYLLLTPPLPITTRIPYSLISAAAIAILPAWARADLRLPYLPVTERALLRPIGQAITSTIRWATAIDQPFTESIDASTAPEKSVIA